MDAYDEFVFRLYGTTMMEGKGISSCVSSMDIFSNGLFITLFRTISLISELTITSATTEPLYSPEDNFSGFPCSS